MSGNEDSNSIILFSTFFRENRKRYIAYAFSYLRNKEEAEDIFMESMIALWENRKKWINGDDLYPLMLTIIKNKCLNFLEHLSVKYKTEENISSFEKRELDLRLMMLNDCCPEKIFDADIQKIINATLYHLPSQTRKIFLMSRQENLSNRQIALNMNITIKAVEYHITKALKSLRIELRDYLASIII